MKTATTYSYLIVADGTVKGHRRTREQADRLAACYTDAIVYPTTPRLFSRSHKVKNTAAYQTACSDAIGYWTVNR